MKRLALPGYAELHCRSNFSFLGGASHPEELVERALQLGYSALAITDECSLAGVVRAHVEAQRLGLHLIVGSEIRLSPPGPRPPPALPSHSAHMQPVPKVAKGPKRKSNNSKNNNSTGTGSSGSSSGRGTASGNANSNNSSNSNSAGTRTPGGSAAAQPDCTAEPTPKSGPRLVLLAQTRRGYGNLSHWITLARRRAEKGDYVAYASDVEGKEPKAPMLAGLPECIALLVPDASQPFETVFAHAMWLKTWFQDRAAIAVELLHRAGDAQLVATIERVAGFTGLPIVAAGGVLMHRRARKPLQDMLTATRLRLPITECGFALEPNAEAHLRSRSRLARLYRPEWLENTLVLAGRCNFSLAELRYEYPQEIVPEGHTPQSWLRQLTEEGAVKRFPQGVPSDVRATIEHELALIRQLQYEAYFLTVADIVRWARGQGILCQGRGSAANSVVCYCLEVTEVNPQEASLLFERFISAERNEPPDIDIDFEHQRREEVIQYIYRKYGRPRAALTAVVICYRPRSALRDVGRALGIDLDRIDSLSKSQHWFDGRNLEPRLIENGFDPASPVVRLWMELTQQLIGFPRHLSQHVGGFVIARDQLSHLVPVENAAMPDRSVVQWDKDDLDALKLIKVDVLALGMLSALRRSLEFIGGKLGRPFAMPDVPRDDAATYEMACRADTVGVFQIESRAQMSMLPRLRPRVFYDLVVQVAIVRPGPIQGGMVHPYLKRRSGQEPEDYPSEEVRAALGRTLGVPIFQEQVMQLAINAADFTPGEADRLRRAMAAWKRRGGLQPFYDRLVGRMIEKGYEPEYAERIFKQIEGFGEYGFPESHAASFALLAYVSSWIKCHHPDAFLAGLLNSQPMGFYAPAQLVRDARAHGVEVRPVDVLVSQWQSTLEAPSVGAKPPKCVTLDSAHHGKAVAVSHHGEAVTGAQHGEPVAGAQHGKAVTPGAQHGEVMTVSHSGWDGTSAASFEGANHGGDPRCAGESVAQPLHAVRLGFDRITGFPQAAAERIVAARSLAPLESVEDLARRAELDARELSLLAHADALAGLTGHRHQAAWSVKGIDTRPTAMLSETRVAEAAVTLAAPTAYEKTVGDYGATGLSLKHHPVGLLRERLAAFRVQPASVLRGYPGGRLARASGLVTHRQQPGTAKGTVFVTLEDETGTVNVIVWPKIVEEQRRPLLAARLLTVYGVWQREGDVTHLLAAKLIDHSELLGGLASRSRDFR